MSQHNTPQELIARIKELETELTQLKSRKKYGLIWEDKPEDVVLQCVKQIPVLKEIKNRKIVTDNTSPTNLLIEGDNYHALSVLNYTHKGKIDVIYIDPPYNTKNKDFIYNDKIVDPEDSFKHSKWLSFMEKRLMLAKELLKDSGVVFVSIDDNEQAQLKILCDSIFGYRNFVSQVVWHNNVKGRQMDLYIKNTCEYILVYAKSISLLDSNLIIDKVSTDNLEHDGISFYKKDYPLHNGTADFHINNRPNLAYSIYYNNLSKKVVAVDEKIKTKNGYIISEPTRKDLIKTGYIRIIPKFNTKYNNQRVWRWGQEKFLKEYKSELLFVEEPDGYYIYQKKRYEDDGGFEKKFKNYINIDGGAGKKELLNILGDKLFNNPKPSTLIKSLISMFGKNSDIILDFMAGSGTTGHAVMELNKEDGGNRQFILSTNNGDEKSDHKICEEVTYERLKRVIKGYKNKKGEKVKGLGGNLEYLKCEYIDKTRHTDNMKMRLMRVCTEMLCLKENTFNLEKEVKDGETVMYKIFSGVRVINDGTTQKQYVGIYYDLDDSYLEDMRAELKKYGDAHKTAYIFSLRNVADYIDDYRKWRGIDIEEVPQKILEIYETIYKRNSRN